METKFHPQNSSLEEEAEEEEAEKKYGRVPSKRDVDSSPGQGVTLLFGLN